MKADVLVVGGGLAGSAAAILLARAGRDVLLVERDAEAQHKVCGEFLSQEALGYLRALGVDVQALGAVPITGVRVGVGPRVPLPFTAMSLTRRCLDEALLRVAADAGVRVLRGCAVRALNASPVRAELQDGEALEADACFLACGKHDLRGWSRPPGQQNDLIAFKMYFRLAEEQAAALAETVELILYRGGYAGLQPVEGGAANLCCLVRREEFQRLGGRWEYLLAAMQAQSPHLRERLRGAKPLLPKPLAIAAIPYGMLRPPTEGLWCVGDQAAVIPSFTGDGMSIALHTAACAARAFLAGDSAVAFQQRMSAELQAEVRFATRLSRGMVAQPRMMSLLARALPEALGFIARKTRIPANKLAR